MLIKNGVIHPMDAPVIENGYVLFREGKIVSVGPMFQCPQEDEVLDAQGGHVTPGYIDAHCHLGMITDSLGFEGDDINEITTPATPHLRAIDALNVADRCFVEAREGGVTAVLTGPGSANPIGGQFAALKTTGRWVDEMVLQAPVSMKMALGENPKRCYNARHETPTTRMGSAAIIREQLSKAREYGEKRDKAQQEGKEAPAFDARMEALLPVLRRELPVHIHSHRADDIATALRICREFDLKCVIVHGTEAHLIPELIRQEGVSVITGPNLSDRSKPELSHKAMENPAILARAGVEIAICTDHPVIPEQYLPLCAALAVRAGLEPEQALAAITINPARIAGLDSRIGSLTPGKDADVVVTSGYPLDWLSRVTAVFIDGKRV